MATSITRPGDSQTNAVSKTPRSRSKFDLFQQVLGTQRFGEYVPHLAFEFIPDDKRVSFRSAHNIRSNTLKAPLLSDLSCKKQYFAVYLQSILPNNWEKIFRNPAQGDDVPADANCIVPWFSMQQFVEHFVADVDWAGINMNGSVDITQLKKLLKMCVAASWIYSSGSLFASLGAHFQKYMNFLYVDTSNNDVKNSIDDFVDDMFFNLVNGFGSGVYTVLKFSASAPFTFNARFVNSIANPDRDFNPAGTYCELGMRELFYLCLEHPDYIDYLEFDSGESVMLVSPGSLLDNLTIYAYNDGENFRIPYQFIDEADEDITIDHQRLLAYNIICAHFYSNDHVDYIYSADLYRQLMSTFSTQVSGGVGSVDTFSYNGVDTPYDWLSGHYLKKFYDSFDLNALCNILNFNKSLRFVDYFTGARTQPLAVGSNDVAVVNNTVSVIDITKSIQSQRYRNAVVRTGSKIDNYIETIFHIKPAYDYHNPAFLSSTSDSVRGVENENTGDAQFSMSSSVTSVLRSNAERYMFEVDFDRPGVIIGITSYDIPRAYTNSVDRQFFYKDRFDNFIPQLQFVGDQALFKAELGKGLTKDAFGYEVRYQEMKLRFNTAYGAFNNHLSDWAFTNGLVSEVLSGTINPTFIRSRQSDLDRYYLQLSHVSLGTHYHFIVVNNNYMSASRPMVAKPEIL